MLAAVHTNLAACCSLVALKLSREVVVRPSPEVVTFVAWRVALAPDGVTRDQPMLGAGLEPTT